MFVPSLGLLFYIVEIFIHSFKGKESQLSILRVVGRLKKKILIEIAILLMLGYVIGLIFPVTRPISQVDVESLTKRIDSLNVEINELSSKVNELQTNLNKLSSEVNDLRIQIEGNDAFDLLKKELANPGSYLADQIIGNIFYELKSSENDVQRWIGIVGEAAAKNTIAAIINSKLPNLVWNKKQITYQTDHKFLVSAITYFPLEIDTGLPMIGTITVARITLVMKGTVDVMSKSVTNIAIESLYFI